MMNEEVRKQGKREVLATEVFLRIFILVPLLPHSLVNIHYLLAVVAEAARLPTRWIAFDASSEP